MNPMNPQPMTIPRGRTGRYETKVAKHRAHDLRGKKREANLKALGLWDLRNVPKIGGLSNTRTRALIDKGRGSTVHARRKLRAELLAA